MMVYIFSNLVDAYDAETVLWSTEKKWMEWKVGEPSLVLFCLIMTMFFFLLNKL